MAVPDRRNCRELSGVAVMSGFEQPVGRQGCRLQLAASTGCSHEMLSGIAARSGSECCSRSDGRRLQLAATARRCCRALPGLPLPGASDSDGCAGRGATSDSEYWARRDTGDGTQAPSAALQCRAAASRLPASSELDRCCTALRSGRPAADQRFGDRKYHPTASEELP